MGILGVHFGERRRATKAHEYCLPEFSSQQPDRVSISLVYIAFAVSVMHQKSPSTTPYSTPGFFSGRGRETERAGRTCDIVHMFFRRAARRKSTTYGFVDQPWSSPKPEQKHNVIGRCFWYLFREAGAQATFLASHCICSKWAEKILIRRYLYDFREEERASAAFFMGGYLVNFYYVGETQHSSNPHWDASPYFDRGRVQEATCTGKDPFSDRIVQARKRIHRRLWKSLLHKDIRLLAHPFASETAYEKRAAPEKPIRLFFTAFEQTTRADTWIHVFGTWERSRREEKGFCAAHPVDVGDFESCV